MPKRKTTTKKVTTKTGKRASSTKNKSTANKYAVKDLDKAISWLRRNTLVLHIPAKELFSSNTQLAPGKTRGGRPYVYLSPAARSYKAWIKLVLDQQYKSVKESLRTAIQEASGVEMRLIFYIHKSRDTTNMVKTLEDAVSEWLGVDDRVWGSVRLTRHIGVVPLEFEGVTIIFTMVPGGDNA